MELTDYERRLIGEALENDKKRDTLPSRLEALDKLIEVFAG
jgi:hypothetical protein